MNSSDSLWSPQVVIALVVLAITAGTVAGVFVLGDAPMRNTIGGLVVGTGLGSVTGFFFGSSKGSQNKDAALAAAIPTTTTTTTPAATTTITTPTETTSVMGR